MMKWSLMLIAAIGAHACEREHIFRTHNRHAERGTKIAAFPPVLDKNEQVLVQSFDNSSISTWSYYFTHGRHVAGENKTMAEWTAEKWAEYGFTTRLDQYYVYLNYPVHQSLQLTYVNGSTYSASLQEEPLGVDATTSYPNGVPAFHGYSSSGNASAEYVYVGRGLEADFKRVQALGIELEGKIALTKYGGPFRGTKVQNAQRFGMIGVVTFTDPGDDGNVTEAKGIAAYPNGPSRNPTSIQRGSVQFLSLYPGDPTTPGYPSKKNSPRMEKRNIPSIPSLPISWIEAKPLLQALNRHGAAGQKVNRTGWLGAIPNVDYSTGPAPGASLYLSNIMEDKITWIWNTIGIINGTNEDEVVVLGNHRDAWMIGGAVDPNAGSAIMIELTKAFGNLLKSGWKPKRTIVLASWDAEEYGLVGSTEWVEEYVPWLKDAAVSYLNTDVAISGTIPDFDATPDLHNITTSIGKKIIWPYKGATTRTLYDVWEETAGEIGVLGSRSDYTSFVHRGGIAAIDLGTTRGPSDPIYHYHSNYDSYHWMTTFGDPGFLMHKALGQYLALYLYHMANDDVLPLEPLNYCPELRAYLEELTKILASVNGMLDLTELESSIATLETSAQEFNVLRESAISANDSTLLTLMNHKARDFSRGFISQGGLPGREFYQNLIFAPGSDTGFMPTTFPGITEAVKAGNFSQAKEYAQKTTKAILAAASILEAGYPAQELLQCSVGEAVQTSYLNQR